MNDAITVDELRARTEGWTPPPELGIPTPRPVTFTAGGWLAVVGVPVVVVAIAVGLVVMWHNLARTRDHHAALRRDGVETDARVVDTRISGSKRRTYHLAYAFNVGSRAYARSTTVTGKFYESQPRLVRVRYAPENPHDNVLVVGERASHPGLALLLLVPAGALLIIPWYATKDRALLRTGSVFPAVVRDHKPHKSRVYVHYSFVNAYGRVVNEGHLMPKDRLPAVGTVIPVLTGPARGASSEPYPLRFARLVDVTPRIESPRPR